eukprot:contig_6749_g1553
MNPAPHRATLTADDFERERRLGACKQAVCRIRAIAPGGDAGGGDTKVGTAWVVRSNVLVTARHVLEDNVCASPGGGSPILIGDVSATFAGNRRVDLASARVLLVPAMADRGPWEPPDVAVVKLPAGAGDFPVWPVRCVVDVAAAADVGEGGAFTLLHMFGDSLTLVVHARDTLLQGTPSAAAHLRSWMVRHSAPTAPGSSGAMLVDSRCEAFALHVAEDSSDGRVKWAVLLSVVHERLGEASPWHGVPEKVRSSRSFHLPATCRTFVGREDAWRRLTQHATEQHTTAVVGLPGVGKSCLVAQWAYQQWRSDAYSVVAWLRAECVSDAIKDIVALGAALRVPNPYGERGEDCLRERAVFVIELLNEYLERGMLLVFDNAEVYDELRVFLPSKGRCIFTARDQYQFPDDSVLELAPFPSKESLTLMEQVSGRSLAREAYTALRLASEVGHLPLAMRALAAYAKRSGRNFAALLFDVQQSVMEARPLTQPYAGYPRKQSVVAALQLICSALDEPNRRSLQRLSLLDPELIPTAVLEEGAETDRLRDLGIISYPRNGVISVHRLVQHVAAAQMRPGERLWVAHELVTEIAVRLMSYSQTDARLWQVTRSAHARALVRHLCALQLQSLVGVRLVPGGLFGTLELCDCGEQTVADAAALVTHVHRLSKVCHEIIMTRPYVGLLGNWSQAAPAA